MNMVRAYVLHVLFLCILPGCVTHRRYTEDTGDFNADSNEKSVDRIPPSMTFEETTWKKASILVNVKVEKDQDPAAVARKFFEKEDFWNKFKVLDAQPVDGDASSFNGLYQNPGFNQYQNPGVNQNQYQNQAYGGQPQGWSDGQVPYQSPGEGYDNQQLVHQNGQPQQSQGWSNGQIAAAGIAAAGLGGAGVLAYQHKDEIGEGLSNVGNELAEGFGNLGSAASNAWNGNDGGEEAPPAEEEASEEPPAQPEEASEEPPAEPADPEGGAGADAEAEAEAAPAEAEGEEDGEVADAGGSGDGAEE
eukprot:TRINITY_DN2464_c2_g1_i1.p1 TRINITY_DN2464_c2_g1~~TRINITY_DN2464_c2_g1_i1.p1  ORF type:complete len:304 (+),score=68.94 TRINITY_DN2464_c2_g1_i1:44-955(+)